MFAAVCFTTPYTYMYIADIKQIAINNTINTSNITYMELAVDFFRIL